MNLSDIAIRRPVLAIVCSLVLLLFGTVSFLTLGVREYPAVDPPIITIRTEYPGASPAVIASQVTEPLEQQINAVDGIRVLSSTSNDERSEIRVEFDINADLDTAANDIRDKVGQAARNLPPDIDPPVVEKADADAEPIIFMNIQSPARNILEVNDFAD
ncbi:MAG TPA: efflux RND transporter permease subunit, partial [Terriglobales bacterium]|nr:efflux RND transporter permease subunit [Terriglobales bacterium]